jgi:WD40 repeat protein
MSNNVAIRSRLFHKNLIYFLLFMSFSILSMESLIYNHPTYKRIALKHGFALEIFNHVVNKLGSLSQDTHQNDIDLQAKIGAFVTYQTPQDWRIAVGLEDGTLQLLDLQGNFLATSKKHRQGITAVSVYSKEDQVYIVSGSPDKTVCIWDKKGVCAAQCKGHRDSVEAVTIVDAHDSIKIVSGSRDETIRIWSQKGILEACSAEDQKLGAVSALVGLKLSEGNKIISGHGMGMVCVWDLGANLLQKYKLEHSTINSLVIFPSLNPMRILAGINHDQAILADMQGKHIKRLSHTQKVTAVDAYQTSLGWWLVTAARGLISIWDMQTQECLVNCYQKLGEHKGVGVCQTKEGLQLVAGYADGKIRVWNILKDIVAFQDLSAQKAAELGQLLAELPENVLSAARINKQEYWQKVLAIVHRV